MTTQERRPLTAADFSAAPMRWIQWSFLHQREAWEFDKKYFADHAADFIADLIRGNADATINQIAPLVKAGSHFLGYSRNYEFRDCVFQCTFEESGYPDDFRHECKTFLDMWDIAREDFAKDQGK